MLFHLLKLLIFLPLIVFLRGKDITKNNQLLFYGLKGYFGLAGHGKTMAVTNRLLNLRKKYGNKIYIATNYNFKYQDFEFVHWKQLLEKYDKPLVVGWDELPNDFNSREYKDFPISLITLLTQQRKGNGVQILYTAQRYSMVDKNFRILSSECNECNTFFGRFTIIKTYDTLDYDDMISKNDVSKKMKIKPKKILSFLQTDKIRSSYDSYKMLDSAMKKQYMSREELSKLN